MEYVIIGNSAAAVGAIEKIRGYDQKGKITVISSESQSCYSRPLITYFLAGKVREKGMCYRDSNFYKENKVNVLPGRKVVSVHPQQKKVRLEDGKEISYDKLLITTGGSPFVPPIKGADKEGVFTFTTWDDAIRLKQLLPNIKKAVVIGGGFIGLKTAEALAEVGVEVAMVELLDRILGLMLDSKAAALVKQQLGENGVKVITENTVAEVLGDNQVSGVKLKDGKEITCQAVVVAIGVRPNVEVVSGTKIEVNKGIVVDRSMQTSVPDIYAAGDVAEAPGLLSRKNEVIPIWPDAYLQGSIAGANMTGNALSYQGGLNMNSVDVFGLPAVAVGQGATLDKKYEILSKGDAKNRVYKKIVLKNNVIIGAIFVGDIERCGIITDLIKNKVNVKNFKKDLLKDDFGYVSFSKEFRQEKLTV
jgi:NAD(P)H-nitrite reductase large subunit